VPFTYTPTPNHLARRKGEDEFANGGERKFTRTRSLLGFVAIETLVAMGSACGARLGGE
jgi:hypothetical protein